MSERGRRGAVAKGVRRALREDTDSRRRIVVNTAAKRATSSANGEYIELLQKESR
jgi:hypothetical protein